MTDDFTEIDGVGPAREEKLNNSGYETYTELAEANHEELAEEIDRLPEDSALEIVVQAQNLADLEKAEVSEGEEISDEEVEEGLKELDDIEEESQDDTEAGESEDVEAESQSETEPAEKSEFEVSFEFESVHEYDTFYHTLIEERCNLRRTNRAGVESYEKMIDSMRETSPTGEFHVEMTNDELNDLHNAVLEQRIEYQGENLIDYMDALKAVEANVNAVRDEFLF